MAGLFVSTRSTHHPPPRPATRRSRIAQLSCQPYTPCLPARLAGYPPVMTHPPSSRASSVSVLPPFWSKTTIFFSLFNTHRFFFFCTRFDIEDVRDHAHAHAHAHAHIPARVSDAHAGLRCCVANCLTSFLTRLLHGMRTWR